MEIVLNEVHGKRTEIYKECAHACKPLIYHLKVKIYMYLEILPCALCTSHDAAAAALMCEVKSKYADALQSLARKSGSQGLALET